MTLTSKLFVISILLIVLLPVSLTTVNAANEDTAIQVIDQAEETLASAYEAVLEAEQAGANVSTLADQLNDAGEHLAEAHLLFRLGDFDGSVYSAGLASEQVRGDFMNQAEKLKIDAQEADGEKYFTNIIISAVGLIAVIFGASIAWLVFKRRHSRQL